VESSAGLEGRRVLVVEDEFLLAMELEALLEQHGCKVLGPAATVEWALAVLYEEQPEVALVDVNLKGQRATPVAAALKRQGVPFVLITGYGELELSEPELRAAPRIDKPVNSRDLKRAVAQALEAAIPGPNS
jgi:DNA-binding NtrC family response regulator